MRPATVALLAVIHLALPRTHSTPLTANKLETNAGRRDREPLLKPHLADVVPPLAPSAASEQPEPPAGIVPQEGEKSVSIFGDNVSLKWVSWNGSLPNGAVGIWNGYASRLDYVCKFNCEAGFYNANKGPYCFYPYADKEYSASKFEVLVNEDNFEFLEWKEGSYGSVPPTAVRTCARAGIYVGKNKYGLGKVVPQHEAFFLPWEGYEYWYKRYQVLAINTDAYSQHISHVEYGVDQIALFHHPPETLQFSRVTNNECHSVQKTVLLEKTSTIEKSWDIGRATRNGTQSSLTSKIPIISGNGVDFTKEQTIQFAEGTTLVESVSHAISVALDVPPNFSCAVRMEGRKTTADIPFKARLSRTYHTGETQWTSITGVYDGVKIGEINAVVDRCQPIADAAPCPQA
ncbi:natterin-3-like [Lepisosteus oculatus]|uniref:natterin-3-like n=1 Tax=Lepisosteus oculatus TaxID=7918 RepID=UPI00371D7408